MTTTSTREQRNWRRTARGALALLVVAGGALAQMPAGGASERMQLACTSGTLAGHTIERSNGSSWWDLADGTVYTTRSLRVSGDEGAVFEKQYGHKAGPVETCTGDHFDWTWDVELAEAGR